MRKLVLAVVALLTIHVTLLFVRPHRVAGADGNGPDIGIVFDVGERGDTAYSDGAFRGADSAIRGLGANVRFVEPGGGSDRTAGQRLLSTQGIAKAPNP